MEGKGRGKRQAARRRRKKVTKFNGGKLRGVVKDNKTCAKLFGEAETLAKGIFKSGDYVPLPFYTEHGEGHCQKLEHYLELIIWPKNGELGPHEFDPSPEEAMYLLSAVWLHDIGMWHGLFDSDLPGDLKEEKTVIKLREMHEFRTARYIHEKWTKNCSWQADEKDWLSNICVHHRRKHPISKFQPFKESGRYETDGHVRLGVLAAILRLVDACHVDKSRAPQVVMSLYISLGMPGEARLHWERAKLIRDVSFDHVERKIEVKGHYPPTVDFGLGEFDLQEVGEMICHNVREELSSVQQMLSHFPNTSFQKVEHVSQHIISRRYQLERECLHLWPYLMSRPFSATEAAVALAQMLLLATEQAEESGKLSDRWRKQMRQIMEETQRLRQHDFMIRNLCIEVEERLSGLAEDAKSAGELRGYLKGFMESSKKNCELVVSHALKEINPNDVLVLYGHSVNVDQLLRDIDTRHLLYIVDCYKPLWGHRVFDENEDIIKSVKESGFADKYKFLQLESLSAALGELKRKNVRYKLLLGTHGRLKCGDLLCKVGSYIIAQTAKRFGAEVIALCESTKFLSKSNRIKDKEIADHEQLFSSEDEKKHPEMVDVPYVAPKMDRLPKSLVDMVITEEGVERRKKRKLAKRGAGRGSGGAKGKKANKAR